MSAIFDPWKLLEVAVGAIPEVAAHLAAGLANDEFDEPTAEKVRKILPAVSQSGQLAKELRELDNA